MTVEIELKFIATPAAIAALPEWIESQKNQHFPPQTLANIYFDTADKRLRQNDIGLRIRGYDGRYEMTVKTAVRSWAVYISGLNIMSILIATNWI